MSVPLSEDDLANTAFAIGVELAARDLYRAAIASGASGTAWAILANQHGSYAVGLSGEDAGLIQVEPGDERLGFVPGAKL